MDDFARAEKFEKKAEKKLRGWRVFGSKHQDAAELFIRAANYYELSKSWDKAGATYTKSANCYLKTKSKYQAAAESYENAGRCYEDGARYHIYEDKVDIEKMAIESYEKAAEIFQDGGVLVRFSECNQKAAQFAAHVYEYTKAIEIYEKSAMYIFDNTYRKLLKHQIKRYLFEAGLCRLCLGDNAVLEQCLSSLKDIKAEVKKVIKTEFSESWEGEKLAAIAASVAEKNVGKFNDAVSRFDEMTPLDPLRNTLLLRVLKEKLPKPKQKYEIGKEKRPVSVRTRRSLSTKR